MKHTRIAALAATALMLAVCAGASGLYGLLHSSEGLDSYDAPLEAAPEEADPTAHIGEDFWVDASFTSHLPLVILDTNGVEPPVNTRWDPQRAIYVPIPGLEPYVDGTITVIDGGSGENRLTDAPAAVSSMRIKRRGNSSMFYEKAQWMVKLTTESGQDNDVDLLGMGAEHEWILNGSMYDKSMLRNYLAYRIASQILPNTPDNVFCEVLIRDGDRYRYQGVYLLGESIRQGPDRVDIQDYSPSLPFNSYLVRRDRYDAEAITLETYGRLEGYAPQYLSLLYPTRIRATGDMIRYVEDDISAIEQVLYSDDPGTFSRYAEVIDVDSFVDYFLLNEFLGNYDAGNNSTYFYKDVGGKLTMGPVWDFDGAMDNYVPEPLAVEYIAFSTKPWFDQLCRDRHFVALLEKRYTQLRQSIFSDTYICETIDAIIAHLGGAQEREWARWGHWYATENRYSLGTMLAEDGTVLVRNAVTYPDEIYRIKVALREHGAAIPDALRGLEYDCTFDTGMSQWMGYLLLLAAAAFLIPAFYAGYRR